MLGCKRAALAMLLGGLLAMTGCASSDAWRTSGLWMDVPPSDQRPSDEPVSFGKEHFARSDYGLAERNFRAAVEANPASIDAWVGLAASYDRLHRFDLADRAYQQALKLAGRTPQMLNNLGYHYLLMGDRQKAREYLEAALQAEPNNAYILGNLELVETWKIGER